MNVKIKTKAENLQLFEEARLLKKNARSILHSKAKNGLEHKASNVLAQRLDVKSYNKGN